MGPCTAFARDFCAGIGPLQLGVVLVLSLFRLLNYLCVYINYVNIVK